MPDAEDSSSGHQPTHASPSESRDLPFEMVRLSHVYRRQYAALQAQLFQHTQEALEQLLQDAFEYEQVIRLLVEEWENAQRESLCAAWGMQCREIEIHQMQGKKWMGACTQCGGLLGLKGCGVCGVSTLSALPLPELGAFRVAPMSSPTNLSHTSKDLAEAAIAASAAATAAEFRVQIEELERKYEKSETECAALRAQIQASQPRMREAACREAAVAAAERSWEVGVSGDDNHDVVGAKPKNTKVRTANSFDIAAAVSSLAPSPVKMSLGVGNLSGAPSEELRLHREVARADALALKLHRELRTQSNYITLLEARLRECQQARMQQHVVAHAHLHAPSERQQVFLSWSRGTKRSALSEFGSQSTYTENGNEDDNVSCADKSMPHLSALIDEDEEEPENWSPLAASIEGSKEAAAEALAFSHKSRDSTRLKGPKRLKRIQRPATAAPELMTRDIARHFTPMSPVLGNTCAAGLSPSRTLEVSSRLNGRGSSSGGSVLVVDPLGREVAPAPFSMLITELRNANLLAQLKEERKQLDALRKQVGPIQNGGEDGTPSNGRLSISAKA